LIGEAFNDFSDSICRAVVIIRSKGNKLSKWTADSTEEIMQIGDKLKEGLGITAKRTIVYEDEAI
jgi:translation initiation factor 4E